MVHTYTEYLYVQYEAVKSTFSLVGTALSITLRLVSTALLNNFSLGSYTLNQRVESYYTEQGV